MSWQDPSYPGARSSSPDYVNYNFQIQAPPPPQYQPNPAINQSNNQSINRSPIDQIKHFINVNRRFVGVIAIVLVIVIVIILGVILTREKDPELGPSGPNYIEKACDNFYHFSCDPWLNGQPKNSYLHRFYTPMQANNDRNTQALFQSPNQLHPAVTRLYASCQDQNGVSNAGFTPLVPYLAQLTAAVTWQQFFALLGSFRTNFLTEAYLHLELIHDLQNPVATRIYLLQGGLTLDETLYSDRSRMAQYQQEIVSAFVTLGDSPSIATSNAAAVIQLEALLLRIFQAVLGTTYNIGNWEALESRTGRWAQYYLQGAQIPLQDGANFRLNLYTPDYFRSLSALFVGSGPSSQHIQYARWRLVNSTAAFMPVAWDSVRKGLLGSHSGGLSRPAFDRYRIDKPVYAFPQEPRVLHTPSSLGDDWDDYCQAVVQLDDLTGDVFGQSFINRTFSPAARTFVNGMVVSTKQTFTQWISTLSWADASSKAALQQKVAAMDYYIAGPTAAPGYDTIVSQLSSTGAQYFENTRIIRRMQELNKFSYINKPWSNELSWQGCASTLNAYYLPGSNAFYLYAGIMQQPAFSMSTDPYVQLQNIAWLYVMGHEMGHGFDNSGIQYNAQGIYSTKWLTPQTINAYSSRLPCLESSYNGMSEMGVAVNGRNTLGENIADIIGVRVVTNIFKQWQTENNAANMTAPANFQPSVYTLEQYFWVLIAQNQCEVTSPSRLRLQVQVDVHSPGFARANGPAANIEQFGTTFGCRQGQDMYPKNQCFLY